MEVQPLEKTDSSVGVDVRLGGLCYAFKWYRIQKPKIFRALEEKLARAQRILSRRQIGSSNWHKQRVKVASIHEKIKNARKDMLNKISTQIVKNHDIVGI